MRRTMSTRSRRDRCLPARPLPFSPPLLSTSSLLHFQLTKTLEISASPNALARASSILISVMKPLTDHRASVVVVSTLVTVAVDATPRAWCRREYCVSAPRLIRRARPIDFRSRCPLPARRAHAKIEIKKSRSHRCRLGSRRGGGCRGVGRRRRGPVGRRMRL